MIEIVPCTRSEWDEFVELRAAVGPMRAALERLAEPVHPTRTEEAALLQIEVQQIAREALGDSEPSNINYANDWSGECRVDPQGGNHMVLREIQPSGAAPVSSAWGYVVKINDIMGGHVRHLPLTEWMSWERQPDA